MPCSFIFVPVLRWKIVFFYLEKKDRKMLECSSLSYAYSNGPQLDFPDLSVSSSDQLLIIGKSGSGKTTLLQILAGLLTPDSGEVTVANQSLYNMSKAKRDKFRGRQVGLVFQKSLFIESLPVGHNLRAAAYFAGNELDKEREADLLDRLHIAHKRDRLPHSLSAGEQQRLGIALALVNQPGLILADEPTSALDDEHAEAVYELLTEEAFRLESALVIVTHDQRLKDKIEQKISL